MSALLRGACAGTNRGAAPAGPSGRQLQRHRPRLATAAAAAAFDDGDTSPAPRRQNSPRSSRPQSPEQKLAKFKVRRLARGTSKSKQKAEEETARKREEETAKIPMLFFFLQRRRVSLGRAKNLSTPQKKNLSLETKTKTHEPGLVLRLRRPRADPRPRAPRLR